MNEFQTGTPPVPGEYQASMEPPPMPNSLRYYWDGKNWSEPYHTTWSADARESAKNKKSQFQMLRYWKMS